MASLSLKHQFIKSTLVPFIVVAVLIVLMLGAADYAARQEQSDEMLQQRASAVRLSFSAYLDRAQFEAKYLAQQLGDSGNLDSLFQLHDVLFFGGLDFFYARMSDGEELVDPRARLYTADTLEMLANQARLNFWVHISTSDDGELLVYKQVLPTDELGEVKGYLYGFISLNNNLALASDLMAGAKVDYMRLEDVAGKTLLIDQQPYYANDVPFVTHSGVLVVPALANKFSLELRVIQPLSRILNQWLVLACSVILIGIALLYWLVQHYAGRWMFQPLSAMPLRSSHEGTSYLEFEPLVAQMDRFQTQLRAREQHLQLLLDSLKSAIIFCDESARVTALNKEAKTLFPEHATVKTIFDMTPLEFHQPIQGALKGDYGVRFELEAKDVNKIYEWLTYSFVNEYGFRGVMLIGRDITEVKRLSWQLESLYPSHSLDRPQPGPEALLKEISLLERYADDEQEVRAERWLMVIGRLLREVSQPAILSSESKALGQLLSESLEGIRSALMLSPRQLSNLTLDIPLTIAKQKASWSSDHAIWMQTALLLCLSSNISGRRLQIGWSEGVLTLTVGGASELTPALEWMLETIPKLIKGRVSFEGAGRIVLTATIPPIKESEQVGEFDNKKVALIENTFPAIERVELLLSSVGIQAETFGSFNDFLHSNSAFMGSYDCLLVGLGEAQTRDQGIAQLNASCSMGQSLPLLYLSESEVSEHALTVLQYQLFSYHFAKMLNTALQAPPISMQHLVEQKDHWILLGGTALVQAVWQSELDELGIIARKEPNIDHLVSRLRYSERTVVLALDLVVAQQLVEMERVNDQVTLVTIEDFAERPDTMHFFDTAAQLPDSETVARLCQQLNS
ncbi:hypothetical protein DN730_04025 [Marinomonas piezotolerans]|uniref:PAS fold-4 domain-containing protein n=1 Tax=Marinomonas piezotolerans TaxID=2213058 RepID=A0A370UAI1_9GAMM|nr:PAS domain-containing protein [Marinomonas piezotolerans]RDL44792.1 hypothetical protein DN730_04025 [Marinomonas piezotolerans]